MNITTIEQLDLFYPGWRDLQEDEVFQEWLEEQPQYIRDMSVTMNVEYAVIVLDNYYADTKLKH